jgi:molybdopterin-guanine dinucleotide biosynthesis protein A
MPAEPGSFSPHDVSAAILAGGQGSRVDGQDKGLLWLAGKPLVAWVAECLQEQAGAMLICANRNNDRYAHYGRVVADGAPGFLGPLAGIAAALAACTTRWLLTVPVDSPCPTRDLALRLHHAATTAAASAAVVSTGTQREPLFAIYEVSACASVHDALARDLPVWRWQDELGAVEVDFSDRAADFRNLNTRDELQRWEHDHRG